MSLLLPVLLACTDPPLAGAGDTGAAADSGAADDPGGDTGAASGEVALSASPSWEAQDRGHATGGALADLDGDGLPEAIVAYGNDMVPGPLAVYRNVGGELESTASWTSAADEYYGHLSVGDVDGDGRLDVAVSVFLGPDRFESPGGVQVFLGDGHALEDTPAWEAWGFFSFSNALGDVDGDGDLDLAVAVGEAYYNAPGRSLLFVNDGAGDLGAAPAWTTESDRHSFDVGFFDLDGDGALDLAFANNGSPHTVYRNEGGLPGATPWWSADGPGSDFEGNTLDAGDLDGDGHLDLVISDNDQLGGVGLVRAWCGPDLAPCWSQADGAAMQSAVSLRDVTGDGRLDLLAGSWWGPVRAYVGGAEGLGTEPRWSTGTSAVVVEAFAWGDLDGDGGPADLLVTDWEPDGPSFVLPGR